MAPLGQNVNTDNEWTNHNDADEQQDNNQNNFYDDDANYNITNDDFLIYDTPCYNMCHIQSLGKAALQNSVIIDSASTSDIISNKSMLQEIHRADKPLHVNTLNGITTIEQKGYLGEYPIPVWYNPSGMVNILSLYHVTQFYHVTMNTKKENCIVVHMADGGFRKFHPSGKGLYRYQLQRTESLENFWTLVTTVKQQADKYTRRAYQRAVNARTLQNIIMRPNNRKFTDVCLQHLKSPVTKQDVRIAEDIFGPNIQMNM